MIHGEVFRALQTIEDFEDGQNLLDVASTSNSSTDGDVSWLEQRFTDRNRNNILDSNQLSGAFWSEANKFATKATYTNPNLPQRSNCKDFLADFNHINTNPAFSDGNLNDVSGYKSDSSAGFDALGSTSNGYGSSVSETCVIDDDLSGPDIEQGTVSSPSPTTSTYTSLFREMEMNKKQCVIKIDFSKLIKS